MSILDDIDNELSRVSETKEELRQAINNLHGSDVITEDTPFSDYAEKIKNVPGKYTLQDELFSIKVGYESSLSYAFAYYQGTELDLSDLNTSEVYDIRGMFYNCPYLTTLDISNFNTSNATSMPGMFNGCTSLHTLRLDNCDNDTIYKIIIDDRFPTNAIDGVTKTIYCRRENTAGLVPPYRWVFSYID